MIPPCTARPPRALLPLCALLLLGAAGCSDAEGTASGTVSTASAVAHLPWPAMGRFAPGDAVIFTSTGKEWFPGVVAELGAAGDPVFEGKYLVEDPTFGRGWYDSHAVAAPEREEFWTGYFLGDWEVSVPVSMTYQTDGRDLYAVVGGGMRLPPLRIEADGSYAWRVGDGAEERTIRGRWSPNPAGPGVILHQGDQGGDWLVYGATDRGSLQTFGRATVNLSSDCCTYQTASRIVSDPATEVAVGAPVLVEGERGHQTLAEVVAVDGRRVRVKGQWTGEEWVTRDRLRRPER